jgi:hypothetical protein
LTQKSPVSTIPTCSDALFIPTRIPPDLPLGGRQNQEKSSPFAKNLRKGIKN